MGCCSERGDRAHLNAGHWPTATQWPALATGLIYVSYAYSGWNGAAYLAGEIRDPALLLPSTLLFGTLTVVALSLVVNLAYVFAIDPADIAWSIIAQLLDPGKMLFALLSLGTIAAGIPRAGVFRRPVARSRPPA